MGQGRKYSLLEAKTKLEALCAYQERCSQELQRKMNSWGIDREDQDRLLAELIADNFLSEERFAEAYASGKMRIKRWGKRKIQLELKRKNISDYSIRKGIESLSDQEYRDNLIFLLEHKWNDLQKEKSDYIRRGKVYQFLANKGYESELINQELDRISE